MNPPAFQLTGRCHYRPYALQCRTATAGPNNNFTAKPAHARVWYVSEEKLEPRLGERFDDPIEPFEQPLSPGHDAMQALTAIDRWLACGGDDHVGAF